MSYLKQELLQGDGETGLQTQYIRGKRDPTKVLKN
jgi:hypothetical protein